MRLEHFQYIVEIARCKSMSKASKKLFITQPSLSTAVQNLEEELGFQIFKRSAAGVALTDKGESLLTIAEEVVAQLDKIKTLSDPDQDTLTTINLTAVPVFCNALMIEVIQQLKKEQPHITVNILELRPSKILPTLISGTADIGIGTYSPSTKEQVFREAAKNNLVIEPIFEDKMYCYLHRNHPMADSNGIRIDDLKNDTPAFFIDHIFMSSYEGYTPDLEYQKNYYSFSDRASIKKAISKGIAYAILPRLMAYDDIYVNSGMIVPVPLSDADITLTTYVAYPTRNVLPKAMTQTIEIIHDVYQRISEKMDAYDRKLGSKKPSSTTANQYVSY